MMKNLPTALGTGALVWGAQTLSTVASQVTTVPQSVQMQNAGAVAVVSLAVDNMTPSDLSLMWRGLLVGGITAGAMSYLRGDSTPLQMGVWVGVAGGSHVLSHLVLDMMSVSVEDSDD
jgi:hypothetical protein